MGSSKKPSNPEKQLATLKQTLQALREEETEDALVETAIAYVEEECDYALIWVASYDRVGHRLRGLGGRVPNGDIGPLRQQFGLNPGDLMEQVVIQQRPMGVPDLREEMRAGDWRKLAQKYAIQGASIFPLRHRDQCLGVVILGSSLWGVSPHADERIRLSMVFGALASSLFQIEAERQRQQTKRPAEPLLALLGKLRSLPDLSARLAAVVDETQRFVAPTRTNVYWFEAERRYFWLRASSRDGNDYRSGQAITGFTAQEVNSFYQALAADQLVSVGEAHSSLKAEVTGRLMQQIQARSLLVAPILLHNELHGFLAVEGSEPRIWSDEEKSYVRGAAQLIALTAPLEGMEETIQQVKLDQALTAELSTAIFSDYDWTQTLKRASDLLSQRLRAETFAVLLYSSDQEGFEVVYQSHGSQRRSLPPWLDTLNQVDWQMLERSTDPVGIENLTEDLKLMAWRQAFLDAGLQSVVVCHTAIGRSLEGLVVLGHDLPRTWNRAERAVLRVASQQIGVILHQWQLQRQTEQQQKINQTIQWGMTTLQQIHTLETLERSAMQQIAQILEVPLAALITWQPGRNLGYITAAVVGNSRFSIHLDAAIALHSDTLVQWAQQTDGLLPLTIDDIDAETRRWLNGSDIGQILVMTLRTTPEHEPSGMVIAADHLDRYWHERQLNAFGTLVSQLAWSRRYLILSEALTLRQRQLEQINWYKHRQLEEIYRALSIGVKRLNELSNQKDPLANNRYQQVVRQLGGLLSAIAPVLKHEQWQLHSEYETMPLASLLKRAMERVEPLIRQRQLWHQVHNEESSLNIGGDISKLELVLHEVLTNACLRSPAGGRLDVWCRPLDARWLELSITDNGIIEPRLLAELQTGRPEDLLAPSILDTPPGLHLEICQALMQQMGSELSLHQLEDGRILSRMLLPIALGLPPDKPKR